MDEGQERRIARNEVSFRAINEQQVSASREFHGGEPVKGFGVLCECADPDCLETLGLDAAEYAHVRSDPRWFVVRAGHVIPEVEVPVEQHAEWWIVQKTARIGRNIAEETA